MGFIPWASPHFWGNEKTYVNDALDSLWLSGGDYITRLEKEFSDLFYNKKVLSDFKWNNFYSSCIFSSQYKTR